MGIPHWQAGRDWQDMPIAQGYIVACEPHAHFEVAEKLLLAEKPVLIEKPMTVNIEEADTLAKMDGIGMVSHPHIYDENWLAIKRKLNGAILNSFEWWGGGPCAIDPLWDWGPHGLSMAIDLLGAPARTFWDGEHLHISWNGSYGVISITKVKTFVTASINKGKFVYIPSANHPTPLENILTQFVAKIKAGKPDMDSIKFGHKVIKALHGAQR